MMIHQVTALVGSHKSRKRLGRGPGSGLGKTCGRGHKGQMSRPGSRPPFTKEGGQMPLFRRLAKRGFNNANFARRYSIINVSQLAQFEEGSRVDPSLLCQVGLIRSTNLKVKILGDGEINRRLTVVAHKFSRSAHQKITSAGGAAELAEETNSL